MAAKIVKVLVILCIVYKQIWPSLLTIGCGNCVQPLWCNCVKVDMVAICKLAGIMLLFTMEWCYNLKSSVVLHCVCTDLWFNLVNLTRHRTERTMKKMRNDSINMKRAWVTKALSESRLVRSKVMAKKNKTNIWELVVSSTYLSIF